MATNSPDAACEHELAREVYFGSGLRLPEGTPVEITSDHGHYIGLSWRETDTTHHSWAGQWEDVRPRG